MVYNSLHCHEWQCLDQTCFPGQSRASQVCVAKLKPKAYHIRNLHPVPQGLTLCILAINAGVVAVSVQHHPARLAGVNHHETHIPVLHLHCNKTPEGVAEPRLRSTEENLSSSTNLAVSKAVGRLVAISDNLSMHLRRNRHVLC